MRLEPLADRHLEPLEALARTPALWRWTLSAADTPEAFARYIATARQAEAEGTALAFATCLLDGTVVGTTRFANASIADGRVEIGWTFVDVAVQRTGVNVEAKRLMLAHAFEHLGATRVEFRSDARNAPSRTAIAALGAVEEGTLRHHARTYAGHLRDTVCFSILAEEWPSVRARLDRRLAQHVGRG